MKLIIIWVQSYRFFLRCRNKAYYIVMTILHYVPHSVL